MVIDSGSPELQQMESELLQSYANKLNHEAIKLKTAQQEKDQV